MRPSHLFPRNPVNFCPERHIYRRDPCSNRPRKKSQQKNIRLDSTHSRRGIYKHSIKSGADPSLDNMRVVTQENQPRMHPQPKEASSLIYPPQQPDLKSLIDIFIYTYTLCDCYILHVAYGMVWYGSDIISSVMQRKAKKH